MSVSPPAAPRGRADDGSPASPAPAPPGAAPPVAPAAARPVSLTHARLPLLFSAVGLESTTAVVAPFIAGTLGAAPIALAGIEAAGRAGGSAARAGATKLADRRPGLRGPFTVAGNTGLALAAAFLAGSNAVWQAGACRSGSWVARGVGTPPLLEVASATGTPSELGARLGLERSVGALGAAFGALAAALLLAFVEVRTVILLALVPVVAAVAVSTHGTLRGRDALDHGVPTQARPELSLLRQPPLRRLALGIACYEASNIAAVLLLLRASKLLPDGTGRLSQLQAVAVLYGVFHLSSAAAAVWGGRLADRFGAGRVIATGAAFLLGAYAGFAFAGEGDLTAMTVCFLLAGTAAGAVDAAEYTGAGRLTPPETHRAVFGALSGLQSAGRVVATITAGGLWTLVGPEAGLLVCGPLLVLCVALFTRGTDRPR
ncbi:MFS transporter [Parafrankia discariae]|uniref:MFS transporter n=1 Tax=Parafrankia discariae TaxID=365528 RepID=UPI0003689671|nr:MFS transporter [Parafrankia discariae]